MYGWDCENPKCPFVHPDETEKEMKERMRNTRMYDLKTELKRYGCEFREDSNLCKKYVDGTLEESWDMDKIVTRMCEMKFLFEYTNFAQYYNSVKGKLTFDEAEQRMVSCLPGGTYPPPGMWPWLRV